MKPQGLSTHRALAWASPRPLWRGDLAARPQLLRFAHDDFMERIIHLAETDPARIADLVARPESWRDPPAPGDASDDPARHLPLPALLKANRRRRLAARPAAPLPAPVAQPLKLWQPAHQRYYLVTGSLACAIPGLPEHRLAGGHEKVGFVLRRLVAASEHAFIAADGRWARVGDGLAPGEELLPLFPLRHADPGGATMRTLHAGLVPVGRREAYLAAPIGSAAPGLAAAQAAALAPSPPAAAAAPSVMGRLTDLRLTVIEPWKAMVAAARQAAAAIADPENTSSTRTARAFAANLDFQMQSWLLILDLKRWIAAHLPALAAAIAADSRPAAGTPLRAIDDWLRAAVPGAALADALLDPALANPATLPANPWALLKPLATSLHDALRRTDAAALLEAATTHYTPAEAKSAAGRARWPGFHFPLAGVSRTGAPVGPWQAAPSPAPTAAEIATLYAPPGATADEQRLITNPADAGAALDAIAALFARALTPQSAEAAPPLPHAMKLRDMMLKTAGDPGLFIIRLVHLNEDCGPLHPPTMSAATLPFQLGSFFDPDAPVRPLTITLPADTSPAGLRKHGRGTAFVMSDMLCGQVARAKGLGLVDLIRHVLPFPLHKPLDLGDGGGCKGGSGMEIGMICSISIPIITLCALILLMIMVSLLDFIFRWVPWFIACFPVPRLKGKSA